MYDALRNNVTGPLQCVVQEPNPSDPFGNGGGGPFSPVPPTSTFNIYDYIANLPDLPQGFGDMDHFNFPTIVHKIPKPIFNVVDLPAADSTEFLDVPWGGLIFANEGNDDASTRYFTRHPHLPPAGASGITIGRGYDLGQHGAAEIRTLLTRIGLKKSEVDLLAGAAGLQLVNGAGGSVTPYYNAHRAEIDAITLTREQQYLIYLETYKTIEAEAERRYNTFVIGSQGNGSGTAWNNLDSKIRDVIVDLNYRGDFRNISNNTKSDTTTPFDDVAFAQQFRSAASSNNVGNFCSIMSSDNWIDPSSIWARSGLNETRRGGRLDILLVDGICHP